MFKSKQEHFKNKIKPYGLLSIALLSLAISVKGHADEGQHYESATNLTNLQGQISPEQSARLSQENQANGAVAYQADHSEISQAVHVAQSAGLKVMEDQEKQYATVANESEQEQVVNQIQVADHQQAQAIQNAVTDYQNEVKTYEENVKQFEAEQERQYQEQVNAVQTANHKREQDYQAEKQRIDAENKKIQAENEAVRQQNQMKKQNYEASLAKAKQSISKGQDNPTQLTENSGSAGQYTASDSWTNLKTAVIDDDVHVVAEGIVTSKENLTDGSYTLTLYSDRKNKIREDNVIQSIKWQDEIPSGASLVKGDKVSEHNYALGGTNKVYDTSSGGTTQEWSVKSGDWVTFPNVVQLVNGKKLGLKAKFEKTGESMDVGQDWIVLWNANKAINFLDGASFHGHYPDDGIKVTYQIDDGSDGQQKYVWVMAGLDIDGGQVLSLAPHPSTKVLSVGGGLHMDSPYVISSDEELGMSYGKHKNSNALDGANSVPDGTLIYVSYGPTLQHELRNTKGGHGSMVADGNFGISVNTNIVADYEELKEKPLKPQPHLELENLPKKPQIKHSYRKPMPPSVKYYKAKYDYQPKVRKSVKNQDGKDVNQKVVAKNSEVQWLLEVPALLKNRPSTEMISFMDYLPKGYQLNRDKTIKSNPLYEMTFDNKNQAIQFVANQSLLKQVNQQKEKPFILPAPKIIGNVMNDAADYQNNFKFVIQQNQETVSVFSNRVAVSTAGKDRNPKNPNDSSIQPLKFSQNKKGENTNHKNYLTGETIHYLMKWDLDQYRHNQSGKDAIAKGFAYIDDFSEESLEPLMDQIRIVDESDHVVQELEISLIKDKSQLSKEHLALLNTAKVQPQGQFLLWTPKNLHDFYKKYVETGKNLTISLPMKTLSAGKIAKNKAYQIDFGNGYQSEMVENPLQGIETVKDVVIEVDGMSLNHAEIPLRQDFYYQLTGAFLPSNRGEDLFEYSFIDDFDQSKDEFLSEYLVKSGTDIKLKDGQVLTKGTDLKDFTELTFDQEKGIVHLTLKREFLETIDNASEFQVTAFLKMKRIAPGKVVNEFSHLVNGQTITSNLVETYTKVEKIPEISQVLKQKEKEQTPLKPVQKVEKVVAEKKPQMKPMTKRLPQTGDQGPLKSLFAIPIFLLSALLKYKKRD